MSDDFVNPFDLDDGDDIQLGKLVEIQPPAITVTIAPSKCELMWLYEGDKLLYITRSAQLHKLQATKEWWKFVDTVRITRHPTPGATEDAKIMGIQEHKPMFNERIG